MNIEISKNSDSLEKTTDAKQGKKYAIMLLSDSRSTVSSGGGVDHFGKIANLSEQNSNISPLINHNDRFKPETTLEFIEKLERLLEENRQNEENVKKLSQINSTINKRIFVLNDLAEELNQINLLLSHYDFIDSLSKIKIKTLQLADINDLLPRIKLAEENIVSPGSILQEDLGRTRISYDSISGNEAYLKTIPLIKDKLEKAALSICTECFQNNQTEDICKFYSICHDKSELLNIYSRWRKLQQKSNINACIGEFKLNYKLFIFCEMESFKKFFSLEYDSDEARNSLNCIMAFIYRGMSEAKVQSIINSIANINEDWIDKLFYESACEYYKRKFSLNHSIDGSHSQADTASVDTYEQITEVTSDINTMGESIERSRP